MITLSLCDDAPADGDECQPQSQPVAGEAELQVVLDALRSSRKGGIRYSRSSPAAGLNGCRSHEEVLTSPSRDSSTDAEHKASSVDQLPAGTSNSNGLLSTAGSAHQQQLPDSHLHLSPVDAGRHIIGSAAVPVTSSTGSPASADRDVIAVTSSLSATAVLYAMLRESNDQCSQAAKDYTKEIVNSMVEHDRWLSDSLGRQRAVCDGQRAADLQRRREELVNAKAAWEKEYVRKCQEMKMRHENHKMKIMHTQAAAAAERQQRTAVVAEEQQKRKQAAASANAEQERLKQAAALAVEQEQKKQAAALASEQERLKQAAALAAEQEQRKQGAVSADSAAAQEKQRLVADVQRAAAVDRLLQHVVGCRAQVGQLATQLLGRMGGSGNAAIEDGEAALVRDLQRLDQMISSCVAAKQSGAGGVVNLLHMASDQVKVLRDAITQRLNPGMQSTDSAAIATGTNRDKSIPRQQQAPDAAFSATPAAAIARTSGQQAVIARDDSGLPSAADDHVSTPPVPAGVDLGLWRTHCRQQRLVASTKELGAEMRNNAQLKKLRVDLQTIVNSTVNAISDASAQHMRDKLDRLAHLLAGDKVMLPLTTRQVSAREHPAAMPFCKDLLAAKFVMHGSTQVKAKHESAFAFAAVAAGLVRRHPDFGELLHAHFLLTCPELIPCFDGSAGGSSMSTPVSHPAPPGGSEDSKVAEERHDWLCSVRGHTRLYFATFVVSLGDVSRAWTWLAAALRLQPVPYLTATVVADMLSVTGYLLQQTYGSQFAKLVHTVAEDYLPLVRAADSSVPGAAGPTSRLEELLRTAVRSRWQPPAGLLPPSMRLN